MSRTCARCKKTVYPLEELKCFDKIWHKSCFRCTVCGMALTLKNYRGFDRMPYCCAHMPKVQATQIASTPEMKRLTNNTRIQSNIKYHEEYERAKRQNQQTGQASEIVRNNGSKMSANVAYRVCKFEHKNIVQQRKRELDEGLQKNPSNRSGFSGTSATSTKRPSLIKLYQAKTRSGKPLPTSDSSHSSYSNSTDSSMSSPKIINSSDRTSFSTSISTMSSSSRSVCKDNFKRQRLYAGNIPDSLQEIYLRSTSGKVNSFMTSEDSLFSKMDSKASVSFVKDLAKTDNFSAGSNITLTDTTPRIIPMTASKWQQEDSMVSIGGLFNVDLANEIENLEVQDKSEEPSTSPQNAENLESEASQLFFNVYRATTRFEAHESDEVDFDENDLIYEVVGEDSGWITGRVERTGKIGLFPASHVEKIERKSQLELAKKAQPSNIKGIFGETSKTAEQKLFN